MNLRGLQRTEFPLSVRKKAFVRCCRDGRPYCEACGIELRSGNIMYEHIIPDGLSGEPTLENCRVQCRSCGRDKDKVDNPLMAKADRMLKKSYGLKRKSRPFPGARNSGLKKKMDGSVIKRGSP